ncbi:hypothetical protein [Hymenobacter sp. BT491]|uniref:hypothetical protein n=1 Tax=Hymenobacter sp. BT491 TaxID=2766779 RepID=UPI0019BF262F|nr:hypothetical protein [Hymenobacter sp. BT491]MBC6992488.1 hypothetical protein [Hymenobacter sp. BT491]
MANLRKALEKGLSVAETVDLTGISLSSVKHYRKDLQAALTYCPDYPEGLGVILSPPCYKKASLGKAGTVAHAPVYRPAGIFTSGYLSLC